MSLVINAPAVEGKLRSEAARRGVAAGDLAAEILSEHLISAPGENDAQPFYATATVEEWTQALDEWIASHPVRKPLPASALTRESFYEGRA